MPETKNQNEIVKTSVRLTKQLHKDLKQFCLDTERTEVDVISNAIEEFIRNHKKK